MLLSPAPLHPTQLQAMTSGMLLAGEAPFIARTVPTKMEGETCSSCLQFSMQTCSTPANINLKSLGIVYMFARRQHQPAGPAAQAGSYPLPCCQALTKKTIQGCGPSPYTATPDVSRLSFLAFYLSVLGLPCLDVAHCWGAVKQKRDFRQCR